MIWLIWKLYIYFFNKQKKGKLTTWSGSRWSSLFLGNFMQLSNLLFVYMCKWTMLASYNFRPDIGKIHIRAACLEASFPSDVWSGALLKNCYFFLCSPFCIHEYDDFTYLLTYRINTKPSNSASKDAFARLSWGGGKPGKFSAAQEILCETWQGQSNHSYILQGFSLT